MKRRARAQPLDSLIVPVRPPENGHYSFEQVVIRKGSVLEFTRVGFQGFSRGQVLELKKLASGKPSLRLLVTHWIPDARTLRLRGSLAVWIGERAILKVLSTTKGST